MGINSRYVPSRGHYSGTISASAFVGDGSGLTGISGSGVPGGAANQVQTNNGAGAFSGSANFVFDGSSVGITGTLNVSGTMVADSKGELHRANYVAIPVTVVSKTSNHRYNGQGSSAGYHLNGFESPYLDVYVGKTYRFTQNDSSNSGHPFRFYLDAAKNTSYTANVTTNGSGGSTGDYAQILITEDTPPIIYYQCSNHGYMGNVLYVHGATNASGSFSGSFVGDGSGLTGISGSGTPGGSNTQIQFNNSGNFGGSSNLTFDGTTLTTQRITASVHVSASVFYGDGSNLTGISGSGGGTPGGSNNQVQFKDGSNFGGSSKFVFDGNSVGVTGTLNVSGTMVADSKGELHRANYVAIPVTVVSKTANHRYNGQGSSAGYHLNGFEAPYLDAYVGKTYRFTQNDSSNSGHPFRFYLDAAKTTAYTTNVTTNGSGGSTGDYAQIQITEDTPPILYYQCSNHGYMGNVLYIHGAKNASGSFSGSFVGDGSGLTGVGGSPGGSTTQVQFNNGGSFAGSSNLTFDGTTLTASITGSSLEYTAGTVNTLTASSHVSASLFFGDGSNLTGISGSGVPGGSNNQVQFKDGSNFGGSANLTFDGTSLTTQRVTASVHMSASLYFGDGSNLTGISGSGVPGGANTQVQFKDGSNFAGSSNLTFDGTTLTASISGSALEYTTATVNTLTASTHISASTFHGDGSNLTGISAGGGSAADSDQTILAVQVFG